MPEGDVVFRSAHTLHRAFAGEPLVRAELRWGSLGSVDLVGATTIEVVPRGKHLLHRLDTGWTLHTHLRMEGSWRLEETRTPPVRLTAPKIRAVLATSRWTAVGWSLGMLDLLRTDEEDSIVGHLGPDLLGPDWDAAVADANLARDDRTIGEALLDQRNLAGLGTLWTAESLYAARLNPWTPARSLEDTTRARLLTAAHRLLNAATRSDWSHAGSGRVTDRGPQVYRRLHQACRRCGTPITAGTIGVAPQQRTLFFCPGCQPPQHQGG